jgi:hypothetical protein
MPGFSGMMQVNIKGLPHLEQGGRNLFDICTLSAIVITDIMDIVRNGALLRGGDLRMITSRDVHLS